MFFAFSQRLEINSGIFLWKNNLCSFRVLGRKILNLELHAIFNPSKFYSNPNIWLSLHKSIPTVTNFVFVVAMITQKEYPVDFGGTFVTFVTLSSRQNKDHITKILFHICMNNIFEHVSICGNWNFVHTMYVRIGALLAC